MAQGLRDRINDSLKQAMKAGDKRRTGTLRLVNAAIKDRDISKRTSGPDAGVADASIVEVLAKMIKQRQESLGIYEQAGRSDLAAQEREEIDIIEGFMPRQMSGEEVKSAIEAAIKAVGATGMKDMGKVIAELKARHAGQVDVGKASAVVKGMLAS